MSKDSGLGDQLYVSGYDLSGDVGSLSRIACPRPTLPATGISSSARERLQGLSDGEIAFNTYFNDADDAEHEVLKASAAIEYVMYFRGTTLGNPAAMLVALQTNYDWARNQDGSLLGTVQALSKGAIGASPLNKGLEWGTMITAGKITHASATSTTGEVTAQTTAGYAAQLQIFSLASGTPTITIEDSSDTTTGADGTWATLEAFSINSAQTSERIEGTGTVDKGLRLTTTGVFTNLVFAVALRRGLAVDSVAYV